MKPQEGIMDVRFDAPAIERVQGTGNQEQTVCEIPKFFHRRTRMRKPKTAATTSFKTKIISTTLHQLSRSFQNFL